MFVLLWKEIFIDHFNTLEDVIDTVQEHYKSWLEDPAADPDAYMAEFSLYKIYKPVDFAKLMKKRL